MEPALARVQGRVPVQWRPNRLSQEKLGVTWLKRLSDAEKSCNTKQDELKPRVNLRKAGEICQEECIKGPITASRNFKGQ